MLGVCFCDLALLLLLLYGFFFRHEDDDGPACVFLSTKGKQDHKCTFPWLLNRNGFAALEVVYAIICQRADGSE